MHLDARVASLVPGSCDKGVGLDIRNMDGLRGARILLTLFHLESGSEEGGARLSYERGVSRRLVDVRTLGR